MPHIMVSTRTGTTLVPLAPAVVIGRSPGCLVRVDDPAVPAHWLELRWRGEGWAWRVLAAEDRTRGSGAVVEPGWRRMTAGNGRGTRVVLGDVSVELVDDAAPEAFLWELGTERTIEGAAMEELVEVRGPALLPLGAEGDVAAALRDGQVFVAEGPDGPRIVRAHLPGALAPTILGKLDLESGPVDAEVDLSRNVLVLSRGMSSVEVQGACVRALALYARAQELSRDGWITAAEAWSFWVALGGPTTSPMDAVGWERGRLRRLLDRAGVSSLDLLVERKKEGAMSMTRLGAGVQQVTVRNP